MNEPRKKIERNTCNAQVDFIFDAVETVKYAPIE